MESTCYVLCLATKTWVSVVQCCQMWTNISWRDWWASAKNLSICFVGVRKKPSRLLALHTLVLRCNNLCLLLWRNPKHTFGPTLRVVDVPQVISDNCKVNAAKRGLQTEQQKVWDIGEGLCHTKHRGEQIKQIQRLVLVCEGPLTCKKFRQFWQRRVWLLQCPRNTRLRSWVGPFWSLGSFPLKSPDRNNQAQSGAGNVWTQLERDCIEIGVTLCWRNKRQVWLHWKSANRFGQRNVGKLVHLYGRVHHDPSEQAVRAFCETEETVAQFMSSIPSGSSQHRNCEKPLRKSFNVE